MIVWRRGNCSVTAASFTGEHRTTRIGRASPCGWKETLEQSTATQLIATPDISTAAALPVVRYEPASFLERAVTMAGVTLPLAGLVAAIAMLWGRGFSWVDLGLLIGMYVATAIGITVGYHRLFTHKSFETVPLIKFLLAVLGSMALEGPMLKWVAMHRRHHQHSDDVDDPHSPHHHGGGLKGLVLGFWHAHVGWIFTKDPSDLSKYVGDLVRDRVLRLISNTWFLWAAVGLLLPALLGGLITRSWTGVLCGFLWGGLARIFLVHHITWSINSVCHLWGTRPFDSHDQSRNNLVFGVLGFGEGWHNNHHAFPTSARHGLFWWQIDFSYYIIRGLEFLRLAWKVRVPDPTRLAAKLAAGAAQA
jgi:stearoyl-CoA desaturase (delta-9 desaturase)